MDGWRRRKEWWRNGGGGEREGGGGGSEGKEGKGWRKGRDGGRDGEEGKGWWRGRDGGGGEGMGEEGKGKEWNGEGMEWNVIPDLKPHPLPHPQAIRSSFGNGTRAFSEVEMTAAVSIFAIGGMVGSLPTGTIADLVGRLATPTSHTHRK